MKQADTETILWAAFSAGAVIGASMVARRGADAIWRLTRDDAPPADLADPRARWTTVALWAGLSGVCVATARLAARGLARKTWQKQIGYRLPGR